ncbi:hypothetical protein AVEN_154884-1 [Araneus ventricosus]|uniref:Uncharacterized protein n=1 Tax=Araneus ventricosus TaxID=182803 RepID=A0A4Y2A6U2_ARAVE|nr:hypothetical protein AVEN_154884-1 [Araneus ventricosus]
MQSTPTAKLAKIHKIFYVASFQSLRQLQCSRRLMFLLLISRSRCGVKWLTRMGYHSWDSNHSAILSYTWCTGIWNHLVATTSGSGDTTNWDM